MKTRLSICLAIAGVLLLGSCAVTDMSQETDFSQYKTFGWGKAEISVSNPAYKSGLINSKIMRGVKDEFERHGIAYDKSNPDLLVSYETFTAEKQRMTAGYGGYGMYPMMWGPMFYRPYFWNPYMGPYGYGPGGSYQYTEGTLIIDVTDAKTNEHIWRGLVKGNVSDVKALQKSLAKGVKAIMKKYPGEVDPSRQNIDVPPKKRVS